VSESKCELSFNAEIKVLASAFDKQRSIMSWINARNYTVFDILIHKSFLIIYISMRDSVN